MRMGSFFIGSLAGAAAVIYMIRNKDKLMNLTTDIVLSGLEPMVSSKSSRGQKAVQSDVSVKHAHTPEQNASKISPNSGSSANAGQTELEEVRKWVANDPNLSATVQEILEHNNEQLQDHH